MSLHKRSRAGVRTKELQLSGSWTERCVVLCVQNKLGAPGAPKVTASMVAPTLLGQRCWVRWPYLQEAIVQGVSDRSEKVRTNHIPRCSLRLEVS